MPIQAYTHLRVISFRQPTMYHDTGNHEKSGISPGTIPEANRASRSSSIAADLTTIPRGSDLDTRMQRFWNAMDVAYKRLDQANKIKPFELKVFIAPEFYFRPVNAHNAYTYEEMQAFRRIMTTTLQNDGRFANWHVVCGSIIWRQTGVVSGNRPSAPWATGDVYYQTCVAISIARAGTASGQEIDKAIEAPIDGIPQGSSSNDYHTALGRTFRQKRINSMNGIQIGVDICLDHDPVFRKCREIVLADKERGFDRSLDLHILTSAGFWMQDESAAAKIGSYMARVDGYFNNAMLDPSDGQAASTNVDGIMMRMVKEYLLYPPELLYGDQPAPTTSSLFQSEARATWEAPLTAWQTIDIGSDHFLYLPKPSDADPTFWEERLQKIVIYPRKKIS